MRDTPAQRPVRQGQGTLIQADEGELEQVAHAVAEIRRVVRPSAHTVPLTLPPKACTTIKEIE